MALSGALARAGTPPERLDVSAEVTFDKLEVGWRVVSSALTVVGAVPGISVEDFTAGAESAKDGCPISNALVGNVALVRRGHARGLNRRLDRAPCRAPMTNGSLGPARVATSIASMTAFDHPVEDAKSRRLRAARRRPCRDTDLHPGFVRASTRPGSQEHPIPGRPAPADADGRAGRVPRGRGGGRDGPRRRCSS